MKEVACPRCGLLLPIDSANEPSAVAAVSSEGARTIETVVPATHDDIAGRTLRLDVSTPPVIGDPSLFVAGDSAMPSEQVVAAVGQPTPCDSDSLEVEPGSGDEFAHPDPDPILGAFNPPPSRAEGSADLPMDSPLPSAEIQDLGLVDNIAIHEPSRQEPRMESSTASSGDDDAQAERVPLGTVILGSYASAVTLALVWMIITGRAHFSPLTAPTIAADSRPDLGADGKRALPPLDPIPNDRIASLGKAIRLGQIEITPLELRSGSVRLLHFVPDGARQRKNGGQGALTLKIGLKNLSKDTVLTPLEPAFVRKPDRGMPDCVIETGRGERIEPYPLALQSEWRIEGESFSELKPGQAIETIIVSDNDARARLSDPMIWRFRIRTDMDQTHLVGVRFGADEVR
jgi:hypothetical protein